MLLVNAPLMIKQKRVLWSLMVRRWLLYMEIWINLFHM
jgi:hypothetical protein